MTGTVCISIDHLTNNAAPARLYRPEWPRFWCLRNRAANPRRGSPRCYDAPLVLARVRGATGLRGCTARSLAMPTTQRHRPEIRDDWKEPTSWVRSRGVEAAENPPTVDEDSWPCPTHPQDPQGRCEPSPTRGPRTSALVSSSPPAPPRAGSVTRGGASAARSPTRGRRRGRRRGRG